VSSVAAAPWSLVTTSVRTIATGATVWSEVTWSTLGWLAPSNTASQLPAAPGVPSLLAGTPDFTNFQLLGTLITTSWVSLDSNR
jgi:hypothetical protein